MSNRYRIEYAVVADRAFGYHFGEWAGKGGLAEKIHCPISTPARKMLTISMGKISKG
ncbi:hypothetical protein QMX33_000346 [Yersinia ruckeri]|uniref:hypothetical protein n=1 Tax=Yersinia ruckeri TaxID=29486 RepID=UPI001F39AC31|nr:hypothetical protein [Yersinia ruckeri]EKN3360729.1 hypothetical protein [Yersinia ruckeri]EKN4200467.1 hypothetical protein [Yersinia ruckeri]EKN4724900.1 hypothetical protein [Yersinia ruckeri]ELV7519258.1 hypothetical protein [Yersinia ruckeri]UIN06383.1 hypothetical protein LGL88_11505 [Yersinia ruckeri]